MLSSHDIAAWLDRTAASIDRSPAFPSLRTTPPPARGRKRTRTEADMDEGNTSSLSTPKRPSRARKTSHSDIFADDDSEHSARLAALAVDDTPRPPTTGLPPIDSAFASAPSLTSVKRTYPEDDTTSQQSERTDTSSKKTKRSGSPIKQVSDRRFALYPVQYAQMTTLADVPEDVKVFVRPLKRIGRAERVLSKNMDSEALRNAVRDDDPEEDHILFERLFQDAGSCDDAPGLGDITEITAKAETMQAAGASEQQWNLSVHYPMLELARKSSRYRQHVQWSYICTATISPSDLVPQIRDSEKMQSRKVDFCLSLPFDFTIKTALARNNVQLNQTTYGPVNHDAIAISIETKLTDDGGSDARNQVSTWAKAQVRQLRRLLLRANNPGQTIPPLPILFVQGHTWKLWCFHDLGSLATFYDQGVSFGSTASVLGTYQVIAALHVLIAWSVNVWKPWIERYILQPLVGA